MQRYTFYETDSRPPLPAHHMYACMDGVDVYLASDVDALRDAAANLVRAIEKRRDLSAEITAKGHPPHPDFWHQAIQEREDEITAALAACKSIGL